MFVPEEDVPGNPTSDAGPERPPRATPKVRLLTPEERGAQAEAFSREADREDFWDTVRTLGECFLWCVVGLALMSWSVATTNEVWAPVLFWGGLATGNGGVLIALVGAYARTGERNG